MLAPLSSSPAPTLLVDELEARERAARWLAALAVCIHLATLGNGFAMDDQYNLVANAEIRALRNIPGLFTHAWTAAAQGGLDHAIGLSYWRPLAALTWTLEYALWGLHPAGYHAVNVLLHGLVTLQVARLAGQWSGARGAWLAGGLFAVHPVHTEVVALVTYRSELLATGAVVLALGLRLGEATAGWGRRLALWGLYAVGLLAKESAAVLPALLLAQDLAQGRRWREHTALYAGFAAVAAAWLALRAALVIETPLPYLAALPGPVKLWTALAIQSIHARLLLWPWPLVPFYDWTLCPPALSLADPRAMLGLLALLTPAVLAWRLRRRAPLLSLGLSWWLIGLLPTSQLLPLPVGAAERFVYLPSVGAALALAGLGQALLRWPQWQQAQPAARRAVLALAVSVACGLAALSALRTGHWRDDLTLMDRATRDFPESFNAWHRLGQLHAQARRWPEALAAFERAEQVLPGFGPNLEALAEARSHVSGQP